MGLFILKPDPLPTTDEGWLPYTKEKGDKISESQACTVFQVNLSTFANIVNDVTNWLYASAAANAVDPSSQTFADLISGRAPRGNSKQLMSVKESCLEMLTKHAVWGGRGLFFRRAGVPMQAIRNASTLIVGKAVSEARLSSKQGKTITSSASYGALSSSSARGPTTSECLAPAPIALSSGDIPRSDPQPTVVPATGPGDIIMSLHREAVVLIEEQSKRIISTFCFSGVAKKDNLSEVQRRDVSWEELVAKVQEAAAKTGRHYHDGI
jgi:hypothetical protein